MKHRISLLILAVFVSASTGCAMLDSGPSPIRRMTRMIRPKPFDGSAVPEAEEDDWGFVGTEGRAGMERERDPDRWWQNLVMSQEARNIERNLGID